LYLTGHPASFSGFAFTGHTALSGIVGVFGSAGTDSEFPMAHNSLADNVKTRTTTTNHHPHHQKRSDFHLHTHSRCVQKYAQPQDFLCVLNIPHGFLVAEWLGITERSRTVFTHLIIGMELLTSTNGTLILI
jgi:hypothetical protein